MSDDMKVEMIEKRPPISVLAVGVIAIIFSCVLCVWSIQKLDELTHFGLAVMLAATIFAFLLGVDALQRKYLFFRNRIEVRYLFRWKKEAIESDLGFSVNSSGQIVISEKSGRARVMRIPREYNRNGSLLEQLSEFYGTPSEQGEPD